jgi:hypothetical protein
MREFLAHRAVGELPNLKSSPGLAGDAGGNQGNFDCNAYFNHMSHLMDATEMLNLILSSLEKEPAFTDFAIGNGVYIVI